MDQLFHRSSNQHVGQHLINKVDQQLINFSVGRPLSNLYSRRAATTCACAPVRVKKRDTTATSNAVFTSRLATNAVLYLKNPGIHSSRPFSCHSQLRLVFVSTACIWSHLTPLSAPTCGHHHSIGSFSSCNGPTGIAAHHLEGTDMQEPWGRTDGVLGEFRYSRCIRQGGVEAPVCVTGWQNTYCGKAETKWKGQRLGWSRSEEKETMNIFSVT